MKKNDKIFVCPSCGARGIDNFIYNSSKLVTEYRKITKQGMLFKKPHFLQEEDSDLHGLECQSCLESFYCLYDDSGHIIEIYNKF